MSGSHLTETVPPLPFLRLPLELRKEIYCLVFGKRLLVRHYEYYKGGISATPFEDFLDVAVFAVSRLISDEAMSCFFENQIFSIIVTKPLFGYMFSGDNYAPGLDPLSIRGFAAELDLLPLFMRRRSGPRPWPLQKLKRVEFDVRLYHSSKLDKFETQLSRVCEALAVYTELAEVTILPTSDTIIDTAADDRAMGQLLQGFLQLGRVGKVRFASDIGPARDSSADRIAGTQEEKRRIAQIMMGQS